MKIPKRNRKYEDKRTIREIVDDPCDCHGYKKLKSSEEEFLEETKEFGMTPKEFLSSSNLMKTLCSTEFIEKYPQYFKQTKKPKKKRRR